MKAGHGRLRWSKPLPDGRGLEIPRLSLRRSEWLLLLVELKPSLCFLAVGRKQRRLERLFLPFDRGFEVAELGLDGGQGLKSLPLAVVEFLGLFRELKG